METQHEIEKALRTVLPEESQEMISKLATAINRSLNALRLNQSVTDGGKLVMDSEVQSALEELKGQQITTSRSIISFDQSQLGNVNIQDIVNGAKITININLPHTSNPNKKAKEGQNRAAEKVKTPAISDIITYYKGEEDQPIRITEIISGEITTPWRDGTRGSGLYQVPFRLSANPSHDWRELFLHFWDHPPRFTTMHRPGIARVYSDKIVLDGTTMEEVEKYHLETLKLAIEEANKEIVKLRERKRQQEEEKKNKEKQHRDEVDEIARRLKLD